VNCPLSTQKHTKSCIFNTGKTTRRAQNKKENHASGAILYTANCTIFYDFVK
jgi:hypothetical protein